MFRPALDVVAISEPAVAVLAATPAQAAGGHTVELMSGSQMVVQSGAAE